MMSEKQSWADPSPLGLFGLGVGNIFAIGYGFFFGGVAQVIAGIIDLKKGNTFGGTAFTSYGLFWLGLAFVLTASGSGIISAPTDIDLTWMTFMWGIFTTLFFIGSFKTTKALSFVLGSLSILFYLLAISHAIIFLTGSTIVLTITGIEGIICGGSAMYTAGAIIINGMYKRTVLPLGPWQKEK
jgi:succinate-acetate transporter protein